MFRWSDLCSHIDLLWYVWLWSRWLSAAEVIAERAERCLLTDCQQWDQQVSRMEGSGWHIRVSTIHHHSPEVLHWLSWPNVFSIFPQTKLFLYPGDLLFTVPSFLQSFFFCPTFFHLTFWPNTNLKTCEMRLAHFDFWIISSKLHSIVSEIISIASNCTFFLPWKCISLNT